MSNKCQDIPSTPSASIISTALSLMILHYKNDKISTFDLLQTKLTKYIIDTSEEIEVDRQVSLSWVHKHWMYRIMTTVYRIHSRWVSKKYTQHNNRIETPGATLKLQTSDYSQVHEHKPDPSFHDRVNKWNLLTRGRS